MSEITREQKDRLAAAIRETTNALYETARRTHKTADLFDRVRDQMWGCEYHTDLAELIVPLHHAVCMVKADIDDQTKIVASGNAALEMLQAIASGEGCDQ